jgi:hypothetical protein
MSTPVCFGKAVGTLTSKAIGWCTRVYKVYRKGLQSGSATAHKKQLKEK